MDFQNEEFFKELISMFKMESKEHLEMISKGMNKIESKEYPGQCSETMEEVFRAAHSLKGAARTVGIVEIEEIGQSLEQIFSNLKHGDAELNGDTYKEIRYIVDGLGEMIDSINDQGKVTKDGSELVQSVERVKESIVSVKS